MKITLLNGTPDGNHLAFEQYLENLESVLGKNGHPTQLLCLRENENPKALNALSLSKGEGGVRVTCPRSCRCPQCEASCLRSLR